VFAEHPRASCTIVHVAEIVIDTSAVVAVITDASEKAALVRVTEDAALIAPSSIHWEIGNAFSAMRRRGRLTFEMAARAIEIYRSIPIGFVDVDLTASLLIAAEHRLYAYDAYLLECSRARRAPLLTLDRTLARAAAKMMIDVVEVV
jgi:predicted nucleic acid-binding protein